MKGISHAAWTASLHKAKVIGLMEYFFSSWERNRRNKGEWSVMRQTHPFLPIQRSRGHPGEGMLNDSLSLMGPSSHVFHGRTAPWHPLGICSSFWWSAEIIHIPWKMIRHFCLVHRVRDTHGPPTRQVTSVQRLWP